ncbi:MAG: 2Fe-2S ferredoxin-like protein [Colwellia sp.]|nr:2Fe-2S ferredoxin-like protein [Colwellia sp.]
MEYTEKRPKPESHQQKITVQNKELIFTESSRTLLECLEIAKIEVHYHCRDGYCGACRITLNKGEIVYPNGEPLAYVGKNEILPCCCRPTTDIDITVD